MKRNFAQKGLLLAAFALALPFSASLAFAEPAAKPITIEINSKKSLVNMMSVDSTNLTENGIKAAKLFYDFLEKGNRKSAEEASQIYDQIIPKENFGGDYTALQWLIRYSLAPKAEQQHFAKNIYDQGFLDFFAANDYAQLKEYLIRKYKLANMQDKDPAEGIKRRAFLEDFILFENPRREEWEKSSKMVESLHLKKGAKVVDIGSGPGYFTQKFSKAVGDTGKIYAIDTVQEHLDYINNFDTKHGIKNIQTVLTEDHTINMADKEKVDVAWMCSLYHIIYVTYVEAAKDQFVESIKAALKPNGTLYIADNGIVPDGVLPYHAPYIDKRLLIGQLQAYGFKFVKEYQFIPQRYILEFKKQ
ncbi:MAG TPA: methyltransferase domain-containing protein [Geomonas sp.]|nr:methyltransferase domain-containing protein [Geomonas sp.]